MSDQSAIPEVGAISVEERAVVKEMAARMINGTPKLELMLWATTERGLTRERYVALRAMISDSWRRDMGENILQTIELERSQLVAHYMNLYTKAIELYASAVADDKWQAASLALHRGKDALDSIVALRGLKTATLEETEAASNAQKAITNATRESVQELFAAMQTRLLAAQAPKTFAEQVAAADEFAVPPEAATPGEEARPARQSWSHPQGSTSTHSPPIGRVIDMMPKTSKNTIVCAECNEQRARVPAQQMSSCNSCGSMLWRAWNPDRDD